MRSRAAMLAGLGATLAAPALAGPPAPAPLTIAGMRDDAIAPALDASSRGLFAANGLAVHVVPERSEASIATGIARGAYQIALSGLVSLIAARASGVPFVLVAAGSEYEAAAPVTGLLVAARRRITTAAGLNGTTIAIPTPGDLATIAIKAWMDKNGGTPASLTFVALPNAAMPGAIASGRVAAGLLGEPVLHRALGDGKLRLLAHPMDAIASRFLATAWFAVEAWAEAHPVQAQGFARAMRDASVDVNGHQPHAVTRVRYGTALDPALIQPVIDACAKYTPNAPLFDAQALILGS